ncbi:MAG TPA: hypothetical protein VFV99_11860 [Kofleriaceae bacterium]|nr:hypothetical protein [Kofleriaceae bacterium]
MAAEGASSNELAASVTSEGTGGEPSHGQPANSNARSARGTGEVATEAARPEPARTVVSVPHELTELATSIGQAWSQEYVRQLQAQERDIVGAWPGTIREARRQVLAKVKAKLEPEQLEQLAKITNLAARRGWETVSEPDLES